MKKHHSTNRYQPKMIAVSLCAASALVLTGTAWAAVAPTSPTVDTQLMANITSELSNSMQTQFTSLKKEITDLFYAGFQYMNQQNYQTDPTLATAQNANTTQQTVTVGVTNPYDYQNAGPSMMSAAYAQLATQNNVDNTLKQYIYAINPSGLTDSNGNNFSDYMSNNSLATLSGVQSNLPANATSTTSIYPADDNLYVSKTTYNQGSSALPSTTKNNIPAEAYVLKPTTANNAMLNFAALITPIAYSQPPQNTIQSQQTVAENFVKFAAQSTAPLFSSINFGDLSKAEYTNKQQVAALYYLSQSPVYQNFKLNMRSFIALRSVATNSLNQLISERTIVPGLGTKAGLTDGAGKQIKDASPLQVEAYIANHRVQDKSWYQTVQNASPATLQRMTLVILAEMEHQNYEAHLDRERLLAALAALNIQINTQNMQSYLAKASSDVNTAISSAITQATGSAPNNLPGGGSSAIGTQTSSPTFTSTTATDAGTTATDAAAATSKGAASTTKTGE